MKNDRAVGSSAIAERRTRSPRSSRFWGTAHNVEKLGAGALGSAIARGDAGTSAGTLTSSQGSAESLELTHPEPAHAFPLALAKGTLKPEARRRSPRS